MEQSRISRDHMFTEIMQVVARRSACLRAQVGALIVKDGRIISMGYNGPVTGAPPCEAIPPEYQEFGEGRRRKWEFNHPNMCQGPGCTRSLHAETNAIAFAAKAGVSVDGCTLYCTMSPCINCAKVIVNSGIKEVRYWEKYRVTDGLDLLESSGIVVVDLQDQARQCKCALEKISKALKRIPNEEEFSGLTKMGLALTQYAQSAGEEESKKGHLPQDLAAKYPWDKNCCETLIRELGSYESAEKLLQYCTLFGGSIHPIYLLEQCERAARANGWGIEK